MNKKIESIKYSIKSENEYTASDLGSDTPLTPLGGIYDERNGTDFGLGDWQYDFEVEVTNKSGETKEFLVAFQPIHRYESMRAYSGYEVATADIDGEQTVELIDFCDGDETVIKELYDIVKDYAKNALENALENLKQALENTLENLT